MVMLKKKTSRLNVSRPADPLAPERPPSYAIKLRLTISALFMCLILPSFGLVVYYIYKNNYKIYKENASEQITNHNNQTKDKLHALLDPISASLLSMAKQVRDDPQLFDSASVNDTLLLHLENNPNLVSIFLASDKGSFHQVQKMREGMIVANRVPPAEANFNFWVVQPGLQSSKNTQPANSVFTFYKTRDTAPLDTFVIANNYDPRERPFYKSLASTVAHAPEVLRQRFILLDEPYISGSTSRPTMTVSTPVYTDEKFKGMLGESFELSAISTFLKSIQISQNSETYILDGEGDIVVSTGLDNGYTIDKKKLVKQNVLSADGKAVQQAFQLHASGKNRQFEFTHAGTSEIYLAQFTEFPNNYNKKWEVLTLAPVSDFLVGLNEINKRLIAYGGLACLVLAFLTYVLSRKISRPIEILTEDIRDLLDFNPSRRVIHSNILEINILSNAVNKLRNTLKAFTTYVPQDLVNDLLRSGNDIELGGESRYLTILFTDLQGFSSISEVTPSRELMKLISAYLALVTQTVKEETGTVDKFIGDSVMAFWGAPLLDQNHAFHACVAAVKSQRRMVGLNEQLVKEGLSPLTVRIGIHSDAVLVGNIGSPTRMSYTVMGDGVNIAARLEGINKEFSTSICISHATYKEAGERLWTRPVDVITVKGRKGEIPIYELLAIRGDDPETMPTEREQALCKATHKAFALFVNQHYNEAADQYQAIADSFNDDLSMIMKNRCLQHLNSVTPARTHPIE